MNLTGGTILFFISASLAASVTCESGFLRNQKGDLYYFNDRRSMTLSESDVFCKSLSGQLPSLHTKEDAEFLRSLVQAQKHIWLSGVQVSRSPPTYQWMDGSPFDFAPWEAPSPHCDEACCGIALNVHSDDVYNEKIFDCTCDMMYLPVCKIVMSPGSVSQRIKSLTLKIQILDQEMQSFIALTNLVSRNISDQIREMQKDDEKTQEKLMRMISFLNSSIAVHERRDTVIVQPQKQVSEPVVPKESRDSDQIAQLHSRLTTNTICLIIMSAIIVFLITVILYKFLHR